MAKRGVLFQSGAKRSVLTILSAVFLFALSCSKDRDNPLDAANTSGGDPFALTIMRQGSAFILQWQTVDNLQVIGYRVYRGQITSNLSPLVDVAASEHGYLDTGADTTRVYYYAVTALAEGQSESVRSRTVNTSVLIGRLVLSSPDLLAFSAYHSGVLPAADTVTVTLADGGSFTWTASASGTSWLSVSPSSGSGTAARIAVRATTTALPSDTVTGTLRVTADGVDVDIPVSYSLRELFSFERTPEPSAYNASPQFLGAIDLDNDDIDELVVYFMKSGEAAWTYLVLGGGGASINGWPPAVGGDFDSDGDIDVMSDANPASYDYVYWNRNDGDSFVVAYNGPKVRTPWYGVATDLQNNGKIDLVYGFGDELMFFDNLGLESWSGKWLWNQVDSVGSIPDIPLFFDVVVERLNGDVYPDFAVLSGSSIAVVLSTGPAQYGEAEFYSPCGGAATDVAAIENDESGLADLVVSFNTDQIAFLTNDGSGHFSVECRGALAIPDGSSGLVVADFDLNGHDDIALSYTNSVALFLGTGSGQYTAPVLYPTDYSPTKMIELDLDGDGDNEIAVVNSGSKTVTLLRNNAL